MVAAIPAELLQRRHQANDVAKVTCEAAPYYTVRLLSSRCATRGPNGWPRRDPWPCACPQEWCLSRGRRCAQAVARIIDRQGAIQALMHFDPSTCIAAA